MKESSIQQQITEYLSIVSRQNNFLFFSVPNESLMTVLVMFKVPKTICHRILTFFKKMGLTPGVSDLCIVKDGKIYFLEVKNEKGKQSEKQIIFEENAIRCGAPYAVVRSLDEAIDQLVFWEVVR